MNNGSLVDPDFFLISFRILHGRRGVSLDVIIRWEIPVFSLRLPLLLQGAPGGTWASSSVSMTKGSPGWRAAGRGGLPPGAGRRGPGGGRAAPETGAGRLR